MTFPKHWTTDRTRIDSVRTAEAESLTALFNSSSEIVALDPTFRAVDANEVLGHIEESERCEALDRGFRMQAIRLGATGELLGYFHFREATPKPDVVALSMFFRTSAGWALVLDKRDGAIAKVVSVARSIVTYQVGLPVGCTRMSRALTWLRPFEDVDQTVFDKYLAATMGLPLGSERFKWSRESLSEKDVVLEKLNGQFRDAVFTACFQILDRFGRA